MKVPVEPLRACHLFETDPSWLCHPIIPVYSSRQLTESSWIKKG